MTANPTQKAQVIETVQAPSLAADTLGPDAPTPMHLDPLVLDHMKTVIQSLEEGYCVALKTQIRQMIACLNRFAAGEKDAIADLYRLADDIRGIAETLAQPLVGRLANSLCSYLEALDHQTSANTQIVRCHIDAMWAVDKTAKPDKEVT